MTTRTSSAPARAAISSTSASVTSGSAPPWRINSGWDERAISRPESSAPQTAPASDRDNRERAMLLGVSGDCRAVPALLRLIDEPSADCGSRDTRIAALRALGRLRAVEARQVCLTVAETDSDPGTRITAVRALVDLGFEDAPVEAAAMAYFREMLRRFGILAEQDETPTLKR